MEQMFLALHSSNVVDIWVISVGFEVKLMTFWQVLSCEDSIDGHSKQFWQEN